MHIRPAKLEERHVLSTLALRSKAYWGYSSGFMDRCRAELSISADDMLNSQRDYVLAEAKDEILGYYALERLSADAYELEALFVAPEYIGQGIGKALIEHAKSSARKGEGKFMLIQGDPNATSFYLAAGGVQIAERESGCIPGRYLPEFKIFLMA